MNKASDFSYATEFECKFRRALVMSIEAITGRGKLWRLYKRHILEGRPITEEESFWARLLEGLSVILRYDEQKLMDFPKEGPLMVVANHPFGVLDGISICHLVGQARPDYKVMSNSVLNLAEDVADHVIPIYFDHNGEPLPRNLKARKEAIDHLKGGGCLIVFPAGGVSTAKPFFKKAQDAPWQPFIGKMIHVSKPNVVPLFFHGQNGWLFHLASRFSLTLRHSMFIRELAKQIGSHVDVSIGDAIPYADLSHMRDRQALCDDLQRRTYALGGTEIT